MANVIPKIKVFAWRVVQNIIPTCTGLPKKELEVENLCAVYGESECRFSMSLWQISYADILKAGRELGDEISSWEIFFNLLQEKDPIVTWMITSWLIWKNRNSCYHNNSCRVPAGLVCNAERMKLDFQEAMISIRTGSQIVSNIWDPPNREGLKLNVDASFSLASRNANFGMVVRDARGMVRLCAVSREDNIESALFIQKKKILSQPCMQNL